MSSLTWIASRSIKGPREPFPIFAKKALKMGNSKLETTLFILIQAKKIQTFGRL